MSTWKSALALLALLSPLLLLASPEHASANEVVATAADKSAAMAALDKDRREKAMRHSVAKRISRYLSAAAEAVDDGDPEKATELLLRLHSNRLNPYEQALVYRMLAFVAYSSNDSEEAIRYFQLFLEQEMLPIRDETRVRFNIAQLYASIEQWQEVIDWIDRWLVYTEKPDPLGFYLKGIAYYQLADFESAIVETRNAVALKPEPREAWLRLLAALYSQEQDYPNAAATLEELTLRFPKKEYWVQLSLIYGALEDYRRALSVQQVAHAQGYLSNDKELMRLARSYLYHDLPYPAANVLEHALEEGTISRSAETYELLANSWIAAREYERSAPPLIRAAELSEDGNVYVRLGQVHMQREAWPEAWAMLEKAVAKGGLEDPGNANLLLGISYYNGGRVGPARASFQRARQHSSTRGEANRWITHLDTESKNEAG